MKFSWAWYFRSFLIFPVVKFHTSMKPSTLPVTRYCPSGENFTHSGWDFDPNWGQNIIIQVSNLFPQAVTMSKIPKFPSQISTNSQNLSQCNHAKGWWFEIFYCFLAHGKWPLHIIQPHYGHLRVKRDALQPWCDDKRLFLHCLIIICCLGRAGVSFRARHQANWPALTLPSCFQHLSQLQFIKLRRDLLILCPGERPWCPPAQNLKKRGCSTSWHLGDYIPYAGEQNETSIPGFF